MEFRKSIIISFLIHALALAILPGFKFAEKRPDWVEVSVAAFPDIKERMPDWSPGRKTVPEPAAKQVKAERDMLPLPVEEAETGIEVKSTEPDFPEITRDTREVFDMSDVEKVMPGREDSKGLLEELGTEEAMSITGPVSRRTLIRSVMPRYPAWAEEKGVEGKVELKFWVSPDGMVTSVELVSTSGYPDLDSRAMEAVKKYLFSPLGKDEEKEEQWGTITIKYTLK